MSRIGNRKLVIPAGVTVEIDGTKVKVSSSKGTLEKEFSKLISITVEDNCVVTKEKKLNKESNMLCGTTNSLINNMLIGVSEGYERELETVGVGYRFAITGNKINVSAGFSHPVLIDIPAGLTVTAPSNTELSIKGINKEVVTEFAANIRKIRPPEPYKGKGIHYKGEHIRRKDGKKAA